MLKDTYDLSPNSNDTVTVISDGMWKSAIIEYDGENIGSFNSKKELREGKEFKLNDTSKLLIRLKGNIHPKLEVFLNENQIINSKKTPESLLKQSSNLALLIGIVNLIAGNISVISSNTIEDTRILNIPIGIIIIVLAMRVRKKSITSLILICIFILGDIIFSLYQMNNNGAFVVYALIKGVILYSLIDGYKAIRKLK